MSYFNCIFTEISRMKYGERKYKEPIALNHCVIVDILITRTDTIRKKASLRKEDEYSFSQTTHPCLVYFNLYLIRGF